MRRWVCALLAGVVLLSGCGAGVISTAGETRDTGDPKYVALTFDDGPSPRCTPRLLDGLREMGAKATFFVVGCQAVKDPDIVQRIAAEGHQVGNHSYDHADLHSLTAAQAMADLEKNDALLRELLGEGEYWVRPPYGLMTEAEAAALSVPLVNWSVDTEDWRTKDSGKILDVIYRCTGDGDIVLLHDRYQNTVDAVLMAIEHLQQQGYVFVTVAVRVEIMAIAPLPGDTYGRQKYKAPRSLAPGRSVQLRYAAAASIQLMTRVSTMNTAPTHLVPLASLASRLLALDLAI